MDIFPFPAANAPVRATGTKPPQSDSATDAATTFAHGVTGKTNDNNPTDGAPSEVTETGTPPQASPEISNDNNAAHSAAPQITNPPGQLVASIAVGETVTPPTGAETPLAPGSQVIDILQGETPAAPPAIPPATPPATPPAMTGDKPVPNGKSGDIPDPIAAIATTTGDGKAISQAAIESAPAPQGQPTGNGGEKSGSTSGNNVPEAVQIPQTAATAIPEIPVVEPQIAAIVPNSVNAAAQATQATAQGAAQAVGLQPLPTEQTGLRAAAQPKSAETPNGPAKSNNGNAASGNSSNGVNPTATGIPSATQAQNAPGQAIANAAISGQPSDGQQAAQSTPPAPRFDSLLPAAGAAPELTPTSSLDTAGISGVGTDTRTAAQQTAALQGARAMPPQQPVEQVAVQITQAVQSGADKITVQLRPESLGRITVELEVGANNKVTAIIAADKQDTLDLMQRDSRALEKALNEAGLKTDSGSLSFNLRGDGDQPEAGEAGEQIRNATIDVPVEDDGTAPNSPYDQNRSIGLDGGINIRV